MMRHTPNSLKLRNYMKGIKECSIKEKINYRVYEAIKTEIKGIPGSSNKVRCQMWWVRTKLIRLAIAT